MLIDLHVHTRFSPCSRLGVGEILRLAAARGLDGVCLTDHGTGLAAGRLWPGRAPAGLLVVVGQEYATGQGDFLVFGAPDLTQGLEAAAMLDAVLVAGGTAVAAHPCRPGRSVAPDVLGHPALAALEAMNGRNRPADDQAAQALARRLGLPATGGSDAHTPAEVGLAATRFHRALADEAGLVAALRAGLFAPEMPGARTLSAATG